MGAPMVRTRSEPLRPTICSSNEALLPYEKATPRDTAVEPRRMLRQSAPAFAGADHKRDIPHEAKREFELRPEGASPLSGRETITHVTMADDSRTTPKLKASVDQEVNEMKQMMQSMM